MRDAFGFPFGPLFDFVVGVANGAHQTDQQKQAAWQQFDTIQWARGQQNHFYQYPTKELPAGIFWERTGGKTHRLVIRRRPEIVFDLSGLGAGHLR